MKKELLFVCLYVASFVVCNGQSVTGKTFEQGEFKKWAQTPPMGWNSWDCYGSTVEEHEVKANADYMAEKLKSFGWEYVIVDIRWFVENDKAGGYNQTDPRYVIDEYGRYQPDTKRFPSAANGNGFKNLADYVHSKGLKFGIHIMRGIPKVAVERKLPIKGTKGITADKIYSTELQCTWLRDNYTIVADKPGAREYYNSLLELYASWGVDFIKVDDLSRPYHKGEIELIRNAIDRCGRPIVLSTSPGETPIEAVSHVKEHANMWRMVDDVWDTWAHIAHLMDVSKKWYPYIAPGTWPDCDMIPLGRISIRGERGGDRMSSLTRDEQYTLMTLWTIFRSPLMFGGDLPSNDDFTLSLLTNPEVLYITNNSSNNRLFSDDGNKTVWLADDPQTGDVFAALFCTSDKINIEESRAVYNSKQITYKEGEQSTEVKVDIKGAKKLYLVVSDGGDGFNWDHANWIEPQLHGDKGTLKLTDLKWVKASAGWGNPTINRSVGGNDLIVDKRIFREGIGTHSNSIIEYDIPVGDNTFTALAGLDNECVEHKDGATVKFHLFTQYPSETIPKDSLNIALNLKELGFNGKCKVRDLWSRKDLGVYTDIFSTDVVNHGARLVRISKMK